MSTHGQNWSLPVWTPAGHAGCKGSAGPNGSRPQSRLAGDDEGSLLTRVGPIQVVPPSSDLKKNTSVLVLTRVPLRLSSMTR